MNDQERGGIHKAIEDTLAYHPSAPTEGELLHLKFRMTPEGVAAVLKPVIEMHAQIISDEDNKTVLARPAGMIINVHAPEWKQSVPYIIVSDNSTINALMLPKWVEGEGDTITLKRGVDRDSKEHSAIRVNEAGEVTDFADVMNGSRGLGLTEGIQGQTPSYVVVLVGGHLRGNIHAMNVHEKAGR